MRRRRRQGRLGARLRVDHGKPDMVRVGLWDVPPCFRCRKPEFAEYLDISAACDQQQRMGRMYWAVHNDDIVGYMMLAMGSAGEERPADLGIDMYGHIPALAIARLATDKRYERRGIGRYMTSYAIKFCAQDGYGCGVPRDACQLGPRCGRILRKNGLCQVSQLVVIRAPQPSA